MKKQAEVEKAKRGLQSKADKLEKERALDLKRKEKEREISEKQEMSKNLSNIENYYNNQIRLINDQLKNEKFETQVQLEAQKKEAARMKLEMKKYASEGKAY